MPDLDLDDPRGHDLTPEEKIELARRCEAAALEADPRITNSEGGDFSDRRARYAYATSHGFAGEYETSSLQPRGVPGGARERRDAARLLVPRHPQARARWRRPRRSAASRRAARCAGSGARQVKTAEVPVIFDPEMAAASCAHIAGAVGGPALYRRASFLVGKLGERIAAPR